MDRNAPSSYCETTANSLEETERFVALMLADAAEGGQARAVDAASGLCQECAPLGPPAEPVITPRFVPTWYDCAPSAAAASQLPTRHLMPPWERVQPPTRLSSAGAVWERRCFLTPIRVCVVGARSSSELMRGLASIASRHNLLVTSHISENLGEIDWVRSLHPEEDSYAACYDSPGLLGRRTVLAHGVYLGEEERKLMRQRGASVSHCPLSNSMLRSGMLNVRRMLDEGGVVSLGTDVCGGAAPSMLSAIREALKVSNLVSLGERRPDGGMYAPLSSVEAFHLATAAGARSLHVDGLDGTFTAGALFDAVVIDPDAVGSPIDLYAGDGPRAVFEKWLMLGDDRNTSQVYVHGRAVLELPICPVAGPV